MNDDMPASVSIPISAVVALGIEHWRLLSCLENDPSGPPPPLARHALRRMEDFLKLCDLEVRDMNGHPFDAGLAVRVIDSVDDPRLPPNTAVIVETLSPLVMWRGHVVKAADVVMRRGVAK